MVSLGREYYDRISNLYYLYDDFNDRYIHHGLALQMMSAEISTLMKEVITDKLKELGTN